MFFFKNFGIIHHAASHGAPQGTAVKPNSSHFLPLTGRLSLPIIIHTLCAALTVWWLSAGPLSPAILLFLLLASQC